MRCKKALIVINPRAGQNLARLPDILAVFSAAGWKTDIALKEYGGHTLELATEGARKAYDLVLGYGGDGTLNQVLNGVMNTRKHRCAVGLIPGGTANVWAGEVDIPLDPVKAALALVNSQARRVDIGHVEVASLAFSTPEQNQEHERHNGKQKKRAQKEQQKTKGRQHFLLMAGLGIDAAIMSHVSKPLKYKLGPLAVGLSAAEELPAQKAFPLEIQALGEGRNGTVLWKGEALQVVIGNTRRYADVVEMTPNAYIDDGVLDVCVITAGDPLSTMEQLTSLLLRRKPDNTTTSYFHGAHIAITAPASIHLQLDGSAVKLKDYVGKAEQEKLQQASDLTSVMVTYRFDAMPRALPLAIPTSYNDTLFEHPAGQALEQQRMEAAAEEQSAQSADAHKQDADKQQEALAHIEPLLEQGRSVRVVGVTRNPEREHTYIVAGVTSKKSTGEDKPVAVCIDEQTTMRKRTGEPAAPEAVLGLHEGDLMVVEGKQNKRGVTRASRVILK